MSLNQLNQILLKSAEQTIDNLVTEIWSDTGPIASLLKGKFSMAADYVVPEISLTFLEKIETPDQLKLIERCLNAPHVSEISEQDKNELADLLNIEDANAKCKTEIVNDELAVLLNHSKNAKRLLEQKKTSLTNPNSGITNQRLANLAAKKYDDFFILQESYGKKAIDNSKKAKETMENSNGAENTDYIICNSVYNTYQALHHNDESFKIPSAIYTIISDINVIANACYNINRKENSNIEQHQNFIVQAINQALNNIQELINLTDNIDLRQLGLQAEQGLKNIERLFEAHKSLERYSKYSPNNDVNESHFQKQGLYLINKLTTQYKIAQSLPTNSQGTLATVAMNKLALNSRTFIQALYSRTASPLILANENAFLLTSIAAIKQSFNNINASKPLNNSHLAQKQLLKNLTLLEKEILTHNKLLIKQALPTKVWQEYLGLANPAYLDTLLDKLCQKAATQDIIDFIKLADNNRNQTLPKFIKALAKQDLRSNFLNDFMQAPEAVAIFNNNIAKVDQKLKAANEKVNRLNSSQLSLIDKLLGKTPATIQTKKLQEANQAVENIKKEQEKIVAAALTEPLSFRQKALRFVPNLFKRLGAIFKPSQTTLAGLPHPTLQQIKVASLDELAKLVDSDKMHQFSASQLLNLLDHPFLVEHSSERISLTNQLKFQTKIKIGVAFNERFKEHPDFFSNDLKAIYTLKMLPITSQEVFKLISEYKDKPYVLKHISSDKLWQFFQDKKIALCNRLAVAELLSKIKVHSALCQSKIKSLRLAIVTNPILKDYQQGAMKNNLEINKTIEFAPAPQGLLAKILTAKGKKPLVSLVAIAETHIKEQIAEANKTNPSNKQAQFYKDFCRGDLLINTDGLTLKCGEKAYPVIMHNTKLALKEAYPSLIKNRAFQYFCNNYHQSMQNGSYALQKYLSNQKLIPAASSINKISNLNICEVTSDKVLFKSEMVIAGFQQADGNEKVDIPAPLKVSLVLEFKANSWKVVNLTLDSYAKNNDLLNSLATLGREVKPCQTRTKNVPIKAEASVTTKLPASNGVYAEQSNKVNMENSQQLKM